MKVAGGYRICLFGRRGTKTIEDVYSFIEHSSQVFNEENVPNKAMANGTIQNVNFKIQMVTMNWYNLIPKLEIQINSKEDDTKLRKIINEFGWKGSEKAK